MFGLTLPDEAAERSRATMWDVVRFAEPHRYRAIVVENVAAAARWELWEAWRHALAALGYQLKVVYLNSMHASAAGLPVETYVSTALRQVQACQEIKMCLTLTNCIDKYGHCPRRAQQKRMDQHHSSHRLPRTRRPLAPRSRAAGATPTRSPRCIIPAT